MPREVLCDSGDPQLVCPQRVGSRAAETGRDRAREVWGGRVTGNPEVQESALPPCARQRALADLLIRRSSFSPITIRTPPTCPLLAWFSELGASKGAFFRPEGYSCCVLLTRPSSAIPSLCGTSVTPRGRKTPPRCPGSELGRGAGARIDPRRGTLKSHGWHWRRLKAAWRLLVFTARLGRGEGIGRIHGCTPGTGDVSICSHIEPSPVRLPRLHHPSSADTTPLSLSSAIRFPPRLARPASGDGARVLQRPDGGAQAPQRPRLGMRCRLALLSST